MSLALALLCAATPPPQNDAAKAEQAKAFITRVEAELQRLSVRSATASWIAATHITDDTEQASAWASEDVMAFVSKSIKESMQYKGLKLDPDTERKLMLLRVSGALPAPSDPAKRAELAGLAAKLEGMYGKGKSCPKGYTPGQSPEEDRKRCRDLGQLSAVIEAGGKRNGPSAEAQLEAWRAWHETSKEMRPHYERLVTLANEGAREIGSDDLGQYWRSMFEMSPEAFEQETDRLWGQLKPLYDDLHCYVRRRLSEKYGKTVVTPTGPIPAHLLGNMWAQEWNNIYPLVEPYSGQPSLDVTKKLQAKKLDGRGLVRIGETFFTSLGFEKLPPTFWTRSLFAKPPDREVVCHASAWDLTFANDLRIKMCVKQDEEDFHTVHHELGHNYYYNSYYRLPMLYQQGAHEGFHEAVGDALTLSITPAYLKQLGLLDTVPKDDKGLINVQMKDALEKVAFVPFGKLVDQWRWDVMGGKVKPSEYNKHWWALRLKFQGVAPAGERDETSFDPGAKYHVPANVSYTRYFLARVLQYQFFRAMCQAAGHTGPLASCNLYGNAAAGAKLKSMLALGASKPWPDALETLTGQRQMDATAMLEYFQPLQGWLKTQNQGQKCGW